MRRIFYALFLFLFFFADARAVLAQADIYKVTGHIFDLSWSRDIDTFKTLTSTSDGKLLASGAGDYYTLQFTFRTGTGTTHLSDFQGSADMNSGGAPANFMYLDNPIGLWVYPGTTTGYVSSVYNNTYDSVPKTFFIHYGWLDATVREGTPEPYARQVYEKWEPVVAPVIHSFSPASGFAGDTVTIWGNGFNFTRSVTFNGVVAVAFTVVSDSIITATVPATSTGDINVTNPAGSYDKGLFVYVTPPPPPSPVIQSFSPASGFAGDAVTIKGTAFTGATVVTFNGVAAAGFKVVSDTVITATAPQSSTGHISVTTPNGSYSQGIFTYITLTSDGSVWDTSGNPRFAKITAYSLSLATDTLGRPCVLFSNRDSGGLATMMRLGDDNVWHAWGGIASEHTPFGGKLVIGTDNRAYVAYTDSFHTGIIVKRYTGTAWETLGNSGNDTLREYYNSKVALALDKDNTPYLLTRNYLNNDIYVFTYNGTGWIRIDAANPGHAIHAARSEAQIALDADRNVYVIYSATGNYAAMVERYNGSRWDTLGTPGFTHSANGIYYPDIKISKSGQPIVSMQDDDGPESASVFQYDGSTWQPYGKQYFSPSHVYDVSLALSPLDQPFVLFTDSRDSSHSTVMTPAGNGDSSWQYVGTRGVTADQYNTSQREIAVSKNGVIYLAYANYQGAPYYTTNIVVLKNGTDQLLTPRTDTGLYSQGDSICTPWIKEYPQWTSYTSTDTTGTHIEMQTQFQDEPGSLCGFQSYVDTAPRIVRIRLERTALFPRSYRINFSGSPFASQVGIRVFATAAEVQATLAAADSALPGSLPFDTSHFVIYRYDGPNEDYRLDNNEDYYGGMDTTAYYYTSYAKPTLHYYGANNEYCYFEFYVDHFSEFHIGIPVLGLLPVNLLSFSASLHDKMTNVTWQTSNEANASYFTVQRSVDGVHFISVGKVNAAGTSGNHTYSYGDGLSGIALAKVYYRLLMKDKDGSVKQSNIVNVDITSNKLITLQPNPARSYAVVKFSMGGTKTVTVTDMNGRKMLVKTTANSSETIAVSGFAKGLYLVRTDYANGYDIQKLLVE